MSLCPEWSDDRQLVLENKYLNDGEKDWNDVVERLQKASGLKDENDLLKNFDFVPAGRILRNLGSKHEDKTFFNCYVQAFEDVGDGIDSRSAIMDLFTRVFEISARGGGVGINFTPLRPKDSKVRGIDGHSTGTVSWMEAFDGLVEQISQQERRGAYMIGLEPWHPDIFKFINIKSDLNKLNNANLSVFASNDFMEAVKNDGDWCLEFPDTSYKYYDDEWDGNMKKWKEKDYPIIHYDTVKAKQIFDSITEHAHASGEPGLVFLERNNKLNIPNQDERLISTNPCGELSLSKTGVCDLGSINLVKVLNKDRELDYDKLKQSVEYGVEFLDRMIDLNPYYLNSIKESQQKFRRIGLGIMGWADYLILRGIKYGSEESYKEARKVFYDIQNMAFIKSAQLAEEKGAAPIWDEYMLDNKYIKQLDPENQKYIEQHGLRNTRILAVAPTGSISMLAGVSSGLEPNFAFEYIRDDSLGERKVKPWILEQNIDVDEKDLVTTHDVTTEQHVKMQAAIQDYIDSSISKTVQSPVTATQEETDKAFMLAYDTGCKGITYYRDGSRQGILRKEEKQEREEEVSELEKMFKEADDEIIKDHVKIPKQPPAKVYKRKDKNGKKWYFIVTFADRARKRPFALFVKTNNYAKGDVASWTISEMEKLLYDKDIAKNLVRDQIEKYSGQSNADKIARVIGMAMRHNIKIKDIVDVLDSCKPDFSSLLFHIKKVLERYIPDGTELSEICPECGADLIYLEGCKSCSSCNWSACG